MYYLMSVLIIANFDSRYLPIELYYVDENKRHN